MSDVPDTDDLMLEECEHLLTKARVAYDLKDWNLAAMNLGELSVQSGELVKLLRPRLTEQDPTAQRGMA